MTEMRPGEVTLDPHDLEHSISQLVDAYQLSPDDMGIVRRVIALYPQPVQMYVDEAITILHDSMPLGDRFTFDIETDKLILFSHDKEILIDALIEMAMYLAGFTTMMGSEESWVIEFAIGAWKPVKKRLKRQLDIPVSDQPRGVVGMPPAAESISSGDPYPFRRLVSHYDLASFHQMVMLAARDDIAVYFPPETHAKVLAVYVYMRRSMQEVAQGIDLADYETFNARLIREIQRLEILFNPASLTLPTWLHDRHTDDPPSPPDRPDPHSMPPSGPGPAPDPFEAFIEDLFSNDSDADEDIDTI
jgi:hypothetical protein